jgi:hypothetical protein
MTGIMDLKVRINGALLPILDKTTYSVEPWETGLRVSIKDTSFDVWAAQCLMKDGLWCDYTSKGGRALLVKDDFDWYPRTRRVASEISAEALTLAWAVKAQTGRGGVESATMGPVWRHILECDEVEGVAYFGKGSEGACETCYYEYPAVIFWAKCSCGLLNLGNKTTPLDIALDDKLGLATLLGELEELKATYLNNDERHIPWVAGWSKRPRVKT